MVSEVKIPMKYRSYYPWFVWGISLVFHFYKFAILSFPDALRDSLQRAHSLSDFQILTLSYRPLFMFILFQVPFGYLIDRFGPKKIGTLCISLGAIGTLVFALTDSYKVMLVSRYLVGFSVAAILINSLKLVSSWFPSKCFALLLGFTVTVTMLGGIMGQMFIHGYARSYDWRLALIVFAAFGIAYAIFYFFAVFDGEPEKDINPEVKKFTFKKSIKKCISHPQT